MIKIGALTQFNSQTKDKEITKIMLIELQKMMLDSYKDVHSNVALQEYFKNHTV